MDYIFIVLMFVVVFLLMIMNSKLSSLESRFKSLKFRIDQIAEQVEVPEHPINNELRELVKEGQEVRAVKKAREVLGLSLIEAKKYVDELTSK